MSELVLIVAVAANGVIGSEGKLPWHIPADLKHFKNSVLLFNFFWLFKHIMVPKHFADNFVNFQVLT